MKEDIDKGLPAVGKLIDDTSSELPIKSNSFVNAIINGIEKFFSPD